MGTIREAPRTTGGSGETCASRLRSSRRFCSRAWSVSARFSASPEFSRALGLPACSCIFSCCARASQYVISFVRRSFTAARVLFDQLDARSLHLPEVLGNDVRDGVRQRPLFEIAADPRGFGPGEDRGDIGFAGQKGADTQGRARPGCAAPARRVSAPRTASAWR